MTTFDRVRGERKRRAAKSNQRDLMCRTAELFSDHPNRFEHVREPFARLEALQAIDVGFAANGIFNRRTFAAHEVEGNAHGFERQQEIREQDGGVDVDAANRLQRDDGSQLGRTTNIEQGMACPDFAVLGHVAPRLTHEPHRRAIHRLAPAGAQKTVVHF